MELMTLRDTVLCSAAPKAVSAAGKRDPQKSILKILAQPKVRDPRRTSRQHHFHPPIPPTQPQIWVSDVA